MKSHPFLSGQVVMTGLSHLALLALMILVGLALYGPVRESRSLSRQLDAARSRVAELEVLFPLYAEIAGMDKPAAWSNLALPASGRLSENDVLGIPDRFARTAENCHVELAAVSPQVHTTASGQRCLKVDVRATGSYGRLRDFLMEITVMPVMLRIEKIEIRRDALHEQFNILALLALE